MGSGVIFRSGFPEENDSRLHFHRHTTDCSSLNEGFRHGLLAQVLGRLHSITLPRLADAKADRRTPARCGSQRLDQAAVDHEVCARDISRAIAGQEKHQIGDFVGTGESPCGEASL
jgi:hypothetical protein